MTKEIIKNIIYEFNVPLNHDQINAIINEYENSEKDIKTIKMEILEKIRGFLNIKSYTGNKLNDLIGYSIGKTSLNFFIDASTISSIIEKISKQYQDDKQAFNAYYAYLKNFFIDALVKSINIVVEYDAINKIAVNDTFIKDNMALFDELGFVIKILSNDELNMLFPEKNSLEKEKLRYYAYILKDEYLSIYGK